MNHSDACICSLSRIIDQKSLVNELFNIIIIMLARYKIVKNLNREIEYFHETRLHYYKSISYTDYKSNIIFRYFLMACSVILVSTYYIRIIMMTLNNYTKGCYSCYTCDAHRYSPLSILLFIPIQYRYQYVLHIG